MNKNKEFFKPENQIIKNGKMTWIKIANDEWVNLDQIFHVWIEETVNGFFINGELKHNGEEVVLSKNFNTFDECLKYVNILLGTGLDENCYPEVIQSICDMTDKRIRDNLQHGEKSGDWFE